MKIARAWKGMILLAVGSTVVAGAGCAESGSSTCDPATDPACPNPDAGPNCDFTKAPKDLACVISDAAGAFVAPNGRADGPGYMSDPVNSINAAIRIAKQKKLGRVYVCAGEYYESVMLTAQISIYGGLDCGSWKYTGAKATVIAVDNDPAITIAGVTKPLSVADMIFKAPDASGNAEDGSGFASMAGLVLQSQVIFERTDFIAGHGADGITREPPSNYVEPNAPRGEDAIENETPPPPATPGKAGKITCTNGDSSSGGAGQASCSTGPSGTWSPASTLDPERNGAGGTSSTNCSGKDGSDGAGGVGGTRGAGFGKLSIRWIPDTAKDGTAGKPGQGGGGTYDSSCSGNNAGGGGGSGGCGGSGGLAGGAGGPSIALGMVKANVLLRQCYLETGDGGNGGNGSNGQAGQGGGEAGIGRNGMCNGGNGGNGGGGGGGAGGNGGVSAGVFFTGAPPELDGVEFYIGAGGAGGARGGGGHHGVSAIYDTGFVGGEGEDGLNAESYEMFEYGAVQ